VSRKNLEELLDALIVNGNVIGNTEYLRLLNTLLGGVYDGQVITALKTKDLILKAFDKGLLSD
jgi:hypothetical protein